MFRNLFFVAWLFVGVAVTAQNSDKAILLKVANEPVYDTEFVRIFKKNLELVKDDSQKDVDAYLDLFVNYKLKIQEAKAQGLDTLPNYVRELTNYKKQLARNFLTDTQVTEALVEEAYFRTKNEVKASHVLIKMDANAQPADTLNVYNQLLKWRKDIQEDGFETLQKKIHDGKTIYAENLGYFSAFKMVYNFENAAYNTPVGTISMPFKTRFGYHIVTVEDIRPSRGERKVAHIMIAHNRNGEAQTAESRINDLYTKIKQGEDFAVIAKQFSEDKSSAEKGGELAVFSSGQLSSSDFEDMAFSLEKPGDVSAPFATEFGWHIVKLLEKMPVPDFESMKSELEARVKTDSRSQLINTSRVNTLKERYAVADNPEALTYFTTILDDSYFNGTYTLPDAFTGKKPLVTIGNLQLYYADFGTYLIKNQRKISGKKPLANLVSDYYNTFINTNLLQYEEANLETENQAYANIVAEYRDGLLLFDLMEKEIWNTVSADSVAVNEFYQANKASYTWPIRVDADVASANDKKTVKKVRQMLKNGTSPEAIKTTLNTNGTVQVIFTSDVMALDHQALPQDMIVKEGVSKIYNQDGVYIVYQIKNIIPEALKSFDEAKGQVINDYQIHKEALWLKDLEKKYPVEINEAVFAKVKQTLKNN
ncbi:peptidylprolyl isomerase [Bizionia sediminis]|uniref:Peptidylprolyl isomerase n=1 Tax=Bizionia sediminis TaxID=1737064 RepID=A0ABW5KYC8_9FLAO